MICDSDHFKHNDLWSTELTRHRLACLCIKIYIWVYIICKNTAHLFVDFMYRASLFSSLFTLFVDRLSVNPRSIFLFGNLRINGQWRRSKRLCWGRRSRRRIFVSSNWTPSPCILNFATGALIYPNLQGSSCSVFPKWPNMPNWKFWVSSTIF